MRFLWILTLALALILAFAFQNVNGMDRNKKGSELRDKMHGDDTQHYHPGGSSQGAHGPGGHASGLSPSHGRDHSGSMVIVHHQAVVNHGGSSHGGQKKKHKKHGKNKHKNHQGGKKHHPGKNQHH